jgi:hypothetical protein
MKFYTCSDPHPQSPQFFSYLLLYLYFTRKMVKGKITNLEVIALLAKIFFDKFHHG